MAATKSKVSKAAAKSRKAAASKPETTATTPVVASTEPTEEQKKIASATKPTSNIEAGGAVKTDEKKIRMESNGVMTPIKSDFDNPESPVVGDPAGALVGPKPPGKVKLGVGETAAQHEAHHLMSAPENIAERIEKESGPDGLPTDVIAREQQARISRTEFQRVEGPSPGDPDAIQPGVRDSERPKRGGVPPKADSE